MSIEGFGTIAEQLRRSTVAIYGRGRGSGSGVIWSTDGDIVINAHVVAGTHAQVALWDGRGLRATVKSRDSSRDLALLHVDASQLPAASIADSSKVRSGELAIAVGNPLGFLGALTTGVVHAVGPFRRLGPQWWVQADVRLAPGNSGGPLADARGHVIGINTMVADQLALAIPSNEVQNFLAQSSSAPHSGAWLGVLVQPVRLPRSRVADARTGLLIVELDGDSPASVASLLPGDILLGTSDRKFNSPRDLMQVLQGSGLRAVRFEFLRGDYTHVRRVTVLLGNRSASGSSLAA